MCKGTVLIKKRPGFLALLAACCLLSGVGQLFGQYTSQQISGFVKDASGGAIPGATVTVIQTGTQMTRTALSSETGYFVVSNIPIGMYEVSVEMGGFKKYVQTDLNVTIDSKPTLNITLAVGDLEEKVTVTADSAMVDASTGEVARLVTGEQASNLQLNGRNYIQLLALLPGVSTTNRSAMDLFGGYGSNASAQNVNGGRNGSASWNVDGADNKDNGGGGNNFVNVNPDAIAEFKVMTSNYSAEFGQNAGPVVNLALKSGTQNFHGSLYEYARNDAFDARAFNAAVKQKLRYNNFGGNLGGPVFIPGRFNSDRSRLFFFAAVDFKRLRQGNPVLWTVPTLAERNGDFSALASSKWPIDPVTKQPFPNGIIPPERFSPNAKRLIDNYPKPNFSGPGGNFRYIPPTPLDTNQYIFKTDYMLHKDHQLAAHYARDYYTSLQNTGNLMTYNRNIPGQNASVKWTWIANPTTVNTFQVSATGNVIGQINFIPNELFIKDTTRSGNGINYPMIYNASTYMPSISVAGYTGLGVRPLEWQNFNRVFQFKDDFSKVIRTHNLKAGALVMRSRKNQDNQPTVNGSFSFDSLGQALLGDFNSYNEAGRGREGWFRFTQLEFYAGDNWKVTPRFSLDFGTRFLIMQPQYAALNNAVVFDPRFFDPAKAPQIDPKTGYILPGNYDPINGLAAGGDGFPEEAKQRIAPNPLYDGLFRGLPKEISPWDKLWSPRVSIAIDLFGDQSTVLRGGFGVFYERIQGNYVFSNINNPPFLQDTTVYGANVENPAGGTTRLLPQNIRSFETLLKVPLVQNWSFGVQRKLTKDAMLEVSYVGSNAIYQTQNLNLNQLPVGTLQANPGVNTNALRPYRGYATINQYISGAEFNYHSMQTLFKYAFGDGGVANVSYTWSKTLTDASGWNETPVDSYNRLMDHGLADYDRPHVLVASYIYPLPFLRGSSLWYAKVLGGWQVSGITTIQSGRAMNVTVNGDPAGIGVTGGQRPNVSGDWAIPSDQRTTQRWFNTGVFSVPAAGTFGNLARNALRGPGWNNWDLSLQKSVPLRESLAFSFKLEMYNAPNHLSYWDLGRTVGNSNFGQVTSASDPRILQLVMRLDF